MVDWTHFVEDGLLSFAPEPALADWVASVAPIARRISQDPVQRAHWLRHGKTWFVGVNTLPNDGMGQGMGFDRLGGSGLKAALQIDGQALLDRGQISVCYPGYPSQDAGESDAAHRFRRDRFAGHLDGLLPEGTPPRRFLREYHAFILGIPLNPAPAEAAPMVYWPGSHLLIRQMLAARLLPHAPAVWGEIDLTDAYKEIRAEIFETITPKPVHVPVGGAYLMHRFCLHGVAPWDPGLAGPPEGRMVLYFRPYWTGGKLNYLKDLR